MNAHTKTKSLPAVKGTALGVRKGRQLGVTIHFSRSLLDRLNAHAQSENVSISEIVRRVLDRGLGNIANKEART